MSFSKFGSLDMGIVAARYLLVASPRYSFLVAIGVTSFEFTLVIIRFCLINASRNFPYSEISLLKGKSLVLG